MARLNSRRVCWPTAAWKTVIPERAAPIAKPGVVAPPA